MWICGALLSTSKNFFFFRLLSTFSLLKKHTAGASVLTSPENLQQFLHFWKLSFFFALHTEIHPCSYNYTVFDYSTYYAALQTRCLGRRRCWQISTVDPVYPKPCMSTPFFFFRYVHFNRSETDRRFEKTLLNSLSLITIQPSKTRTENRLQLMKKHACSIWWTPLGKKNSQPCGNNTLKADKDSFLSMR